MEKKINPCFYENIKFENNDFILKEFCFWPDSTITRNRETGLLEVIIRDNKGYEIDYYSTLALPDGRRLIDFDFSIYPHIFNFSEGLCKISIDGNKFGFINDKAELIIPCKYDYSRDFSDGYALVSIRDNSKNNYKEFFINKEGKEFYFENEYEYIEDNSDGMFRVTTKDMIHRKFKYHSNYQEYAGMWGYVDSTGKEIIKPQYIYAMDFEDGYAIVCKGEWIKNRQRRYYSEEEKWGVIDKTGKEIIPCIYDEIKRFNDNTQYFQVLSGGWENGKFGIMNTKGEWVVEPIFGDIDYDINDDGCIAFYSDHRMSNPIFVPMGIYSIPKQTVIAEPKYNHIEFLNNGLFKVEYWEFGKCTEIILDKSGEPLFDSIYYRLEDKGNCYLTTIMDENNNYLCGLIDKEGNEILPCKYKSCKFLIDQQKIIFKEKYKYGLMTFSEEVVIEPEYQYLQTLGLESYNDSITILEFTNDGNKYGLMSTNGEIILQNLYRQIHRFDDIIITEDEYGSTLYKIEKKGEIDV